MSRKFNGGRGAIICDGCGAMIVDSLLRAPRVCSPDAVYEDATGQEFCSRDCPDRPRDAMGHMVEEMGSALPYGVQCLGWTWRWAIGDTMLQISMVPKSAARPHPQVAELRAT